MREPFETISTLRGRLFDGVFELVGMRSSGDLNGHPAGKSGQLTAAGIRHHGDLQTRNSTGHGPAVLENESARASVELSRHALDGDVTGGTLDRSSGG